MATIFVTGGQGFLGTRVIELLKFRGHEIISPTREVLEIESAQSLIPYLGNSGVDAIVHLAACVDKSDIEGQQKDTLAVGRYILDAAALTGVKHLVMAGSLDEVGAAHGIVKPTEDINPGTPYGEAKAKVLSYAIEVAKQSGLSIEWVRPTIIYGPGQMGTMVIPQAFDAARSGRRMNLSSCEQLRDFIFVDDVAKWFALAAEVAPLAGVRIHHVGNGHPTKLRDVMEAIQKLGNADFDFGAVEMRQGETMMLGVEEYSSDRPPLDEWKPSIGLEDGLRQTWNWWQTKDMDEDLGRDAAS